MSCLFFKSWLVWSIWIVELGSLLSTLSDLMLDWLHVSVYLPPHELRTVGRKHAEFFYVHSALSPWAPSMSSLCLLTGWRSHMPAHWLLSLSTIDPHIWHGAFVQGCWDGCPPKIAVLQGHKEPTEFITRIRKRFSVMPATARISVLLALVDLFQVAVFSAFMS